MIKAILSTIIKRLLLLISIMVILYYTVDIYKTYKVINVEKVATKLNYQIDSIAEHYYFEGQKDAINKDIRIKLNDDSIYKWIKSPWDSGRIPIFRPTKKDSQK